MLPTVRCYPAVTPAGRMYLAVLPSGVTHGRRRDGNVEQRRDGRKRDGNVEQGRVAGRGI